MSKPESMLADAAGANSGIMPRFGEAPAKHLPTNLPGAVYQARLESNNRRSFTWISASITELLHISAEELLEDAERLVRCVHPEDRPAFEASIVQSAKDLQPWVCEWRHLSPAGSTKHIRGQSVPTRCDDGSVQWNGILVDITSLKEVERELRLGRAQLDRALDAAALGPFELDSTLSRLLLSRRAAALLGLPETVQECDPSAALTHVAPDERSRVLGAFSTALSSRRNFSIEFRRVDGIDSRWLRARGSSVFDAGGSAERLIGIIEDVTAQKSHELAVRDAERGLKEAFLESEYRLRQILDNSPAVVFVKDKDYRYRFVNAKFEEIFAIQAEWLLGKDDYELFDTVKADGLRVNDRIVIERGEAIEVEEVVPQVDGPHTYISSKFPLRKPDGEIYALCGIATDISDRKRDEDTLRESERFIRSVTQAIPDIVYILDVVDMRCIYVNKHVEQIIGVDPTEITAVGENGIAEFVHPDDVPELAREIANWEHASDETVREHEVRLKSRVSGWRWLQLREMSFLRDERGRTRQIVGVARDVTELKQYEAELEQHRHLLEERVEQRTRELEASRRQLRQSERLASLGTLAAGVAHEINNPVGAIRVNAELALTRPDLPAAARELLAAIVSDTERCSNIVRGILKFARVAETEKSTLDLSALVRETAHLMTRAAHASSVEVVLELTDGPIAILGNATELEQVLVNLVRNAAEASRAGQQVFVTVGRDSCGAFLRVRDFGCGMPDEVRRRLFDPFFTMPESKGGTGLGLSIVHGIVVEHGGTIEVDTAPGSGSTFTVHLPSPT